MPEITLHFSKNNIYIIPPVVLGDGHMLQAILHAPGRITQLQDFGGPHFRCEGLGCGYTHEVKIQPLTPETWAWIGWSNSGQNCELYFTVSFEG